MDWLRKTAKKELIDAVSNQQFFKNKFSLKAFTYLTLYLNLNNIWPFLGACKQSAMAAFESVYVGVEIFKKFLKFQTNLLFFYLLNKYIIYYTNNVIIFLLCCTNVYQFFLFVSNFAKYLLKCY